LIFTFYINYHERQRKKRNGGGVCHYYSRCPCSGHRIVAHRFIFYFNQHSPILRAVLFARSFVIQSIFGWILGICIPISVLLIIGIIISVEGLKHIRKKEAELYDLHVEIAYDENTKGDPDLSKKWANAVGHVDSPNPSDWRQAIVEADIILGQILTRLGYHGEGIGEQLKGVDKASFKTLDQAWEAHKIRNQIAHEGSDFAMSQHEAKRVINLYRQVFEEFFYV